MYMQFDRLHTLFLCLPSSVSRRKDSIYCVPTYLCTSLGLPRHNHHERERRLCPPRPQIGLRTAEAFFGCLVWTLRTAGPFFGQRPWLQTTVHSDNHRNSDPLLPGQAHRAMVQPIVHRVARTSIGTAGVRAGGHCASVVSVCVKRCCGVRFQLGRLTLYQLSYAREIWSMIRAPPPTRGRASNRSLQSVPAAASHPSRPRQQTIRVCRSLHRPRRSASGPRRASATSVARLRQIFVHTLKRRSGPRTSACETPPNGRRSDGSREPGTSTPRHRCPGLDKAKHPTGHLAYTHHSHRSGDAS